MGKLGNKNSDEAASHMDREEKDCIGYMPINRKAIWGFAAMSRSALAIFFRPIRYNMLMTKLRKVGITRDPDFYNGFYFFVPQCPRARLRRRAGSALAGDKFVIRQTVSSWTLPGLDIFAIPIKIGDLTAMGKKNKIINFSAGPNFTDFQTAMGLFDSLSLRGKKPLQG